MGKEQNWREEVNKEFYFLYSRGYRLSEASAQEKQAYAIFTSDRREIAIRWDEKDRVYVQIYRARSLFDWFSDGPPGVNVFEMAEKHPAAKEIPVYLSEADYGSIFRQNAEFMQAHLSEMIDGKRWVD
jgi:hypothetical protein